ncbi:MAG: MFS transporter [Nitrososphaeria archaeon]|nr:MFS transporter [Nitrososphaeria archaeon]
MFEDFKDIPVDAKYLIFASFLPAVAYGAFYVDLSYFLTTIQGLPDFFMGSVIMIMGISMVITSIPLGILADKYGRKKFLVLGNILASLTIAVFALTTNTNILILGAIIEGVSESAFTASFGALMSEKTGDLKRTSAFSLLAFVNNIGFSLGTFIIPFIYLLEDFGLDEKEAHILLFVTLALISFLATFIFMKVKEKKNFRNIEKKSWVPKKSLNVLLKYTLTGAILAFGAGLFVPLMARWFYLKYGITDAYSGPILGISNLFMGFTNLAVPSLARRMGVVNAIVATQSASTIFMLSIPFSPTYVIASVVYIVRTFLMNMANPLQQSLIMGLVAEDERGAASGISSSLWRLPNSISATFGAMLMGEGYLNEPFYVATILYIISILLFWILFRKIKLPEEMVNMQ